MWSKCSHQPCGGNILRMLLDKFQMITNCYGGSNVLHMLILHSKCSINVPTSCVQPGTCRNIQNVPNLLSAGKWQVLSTRAYNVLKMFSLVSRPPRPQWLQILRKPVWVIQQHVDNGWTDEVNYLGHLSVLLEDSNRVQLTRDEGTFVGEGRPNGHSERGMRENTRPRGSCWGGGEIGGE